MFFKQIIYNKPNSNSNRKKTKYRDLSRIITNFMNFFNITNQTQYSFVYQNQNSLKQNRFDSIQIVLSISKSLSICHRKFVFKLRQKTNSISKKIEIPTPKKTKNSSNKKITLIWSKTTKKKSTTTSSAMKTMIRTKIKTRI